MTCTITFVETQSDVHGLIALHGGGRATLHGILVFRLRKRTQQLPSCSHQQHKPEKTHLLDLYLKAFATKIHRLWCFFKGSKVEARFFRLNDPGINLQGVGLDRPKSIVESRYSVFKRKKCWKPLKIHGWKVKTIHFQVQC